MSNRKRVFVSNSSEDNDTALIIVQALEEYGYESWQEERNPELGDIRYKIEMALTPCQVFLVLLSEEATRSFWVGLEIDVALALEAKGTNILIVPALVRPCVIPAVLSNYKYLDFTYGRDYVAEFYLLIDMFARSDESNASNGPTSPNISSTSKLSPPMTYSIGTITANTVNLNQGQHITNNNTYMYGNSSSHNTEDKRYLAEFVLFMSELQKSLQKGLQIDTESQDQLLTLMSTINSKSIHLPISFIKQVRAFCHQLDLESLL